jgi:hypothetical protein
MCGTPVGWMPDTITCGELVVCGVGDGEGGLGKELVVMRRVRGLCMVRRDWRAAFLQVWSMVVGGGEGK